MKARWHGREEDYGARDRRNVGNISQLTVHATRSRNFIRIPLLVEFSANATQIVSLTFDIGTDTTSQQSEDVTLSIQSWKTRELQMLSHKGTERYDGIHGVVRPGKLIDGRGEVLQVEGIGLRASRQGNQAVHLRTPMTFWQCIPLLTSYLHFLYAWNGMRGSIPSKLGQT
ncbi:hypothetical protein ACMFMG_005767 [Clarireedia jacksonii]